jgi:hypothetical protein
MQMEEWYRMANIDGFVKADIVLDTVNDYIYSPQMAQQNDLRGRTLYVQVRNGGVVQDQTGLQLTLGWRHKENLTIGLDSFEEADITEGVFKLSYPQALLQPGTAVCTIVITDTQTGQITHSRNFDLKIAPTAYDMEAVAADNSFTTLQQILQLWFDLPDNFDAAITQFQTDGEAAIEDFNDNSATVILQFEQNGQSAIQTFNQNGATEISEFEAEAQAVLDSYAEHFRGNFPTIEVLTEQIPVGRAGDYALIGTAGVDTSTAVWDPSDNQWVLQSSGGSPETTKVLYESNPDTNAYTDAEKAKLATVLTTADKGEVSGVAPLDASAKVPGVNLPDESTNKATASIANGTLVIESAYQKSGTYYAVQFVAPADFDPAQAVTIDGVTVSLTDLLGEPLSDAWKAGAPVTLTRRDTTAFFKTGGGGGLNFKVISVADEGSLPETAAENTIAVVTDTPITGYQLSYLNDAPLKTGQVWIGLATTSPLGINILKGKNAVWAYPSSECKQYNGTAWVDRVYRLRKDGAWQSSIKYLFNGGVIYGGWVARMSSSADYGNYSVWSNSYWEGKTGWHNVTQDATGQKSAAVDFTNYRYLRARVSENGGSGTRATPSCGFSAASGRLVTDIPRSSLGAGATGIITVDISAVTGNQYVYIGATGGYGNTTTRFNQVWLE